MEILDIIKGRRSIRDFEEREVEKEKIEKIIEAGLWAPSAANRQPWKIVVVQKKELINELKKLTFKAFKEYTEEKLSRLYPKHPFVVTSTGSFSETLGNAPLVFAIFNEILENEHETILGMQSTSALIQNILLESYSLGLGSCWVSDIILYSDEVAKLFGLDSKKYKLTAVIPVGYPKKEAKPIPRKESRVIYF
ncbi:MAG TPA: nitroreductase family protein [Spirochaetota bacterium]|nr:nitroreductase family protein [Spirochaetota bacterium]HOM39065.1 nitroreductase family protein [Spirochaetota bacterium]HPQ49971.1 nitroreductase family protein [Spirochaetota bacterium]